MDPFGLSPVVKICGLPLQTPFPPLSPPALIYVWTPSSYCFQSMWLGWAPRESYELRPDL